MGFLQGKKILVTGLLSNRSIAYGIAKAHEPRRRGARVHLSEQRYQGTRGSACGGLRPRAGSTCDVSNDAEIDRLFTDLREQWDGLDGIVHSIAFAPREALKGGFLDGLTRDAFRIAHDVSAYSFAALAKAGLPMMEGRKAALLTLTYLGAQRSVQNYNVMGLAKASLEASSPLPRPGAGTQGHPRQRHIGGAHQDACGGRHQRLQQDTQVRRGQRAAAPERHDEDVGNAAAFLMSDLAARHHRRDHVRRRGFQHHRRWRGL